MRVFELNKEKVICEIREWAKNLSKDKNIAKIILFGSLVKDNATAFSDADILIVIKSSNLKFHERIPEFLPAKLSIPVDIFPYTIDEFNKLLSENYSIPYIANKEGIVLYDG